MYLARQTNKSTNNFIFSSFEFPSNISELAEECGIDFLAIEEEIRDAAELCTRLVLKNSSINHAVISSSYKNKSAVYVEPKGMQNVIVTFNTLKHGGRRNSVALRREKQYFGDDLNKKDPKYITADAALERRKKQEIERRERSFRRLSRDKKRAEESKNKTYDFNYYNGVYQRAKTYSNFPYAEEKELQGKIEAKCFYNNGELAAIIPYHRLMFDGDEASSEITAYELIDSKDKKKRVKFEGASKGSMYFEGFDIKDLQVVIAENPSNDPLNKIYLHEGYGSAATLNNVLGGGFHISSGGAGNINNVIESLIIIFGEEVKKHFIYAYDHDVHKKINAGRLAALDAAYRFKIKAVGLDMSTEKSGSDCNDYFQYHGKEALKKEFLSINKRKRFEGSKLIVLPKNMDKIDYLYARLNCFKKPPAKEIRNFVSACITKCIPKHEIALYLSGIKSPMDVNRVDAIYDDVHSFLISKLERYNSVKDTIKVHAVQNDKGHWVLPPDFIEKYIKDEPNGIYALIGGVGTAKTENFLKPGMDSAYGRAALLTHRISLARELSSRLNILCYLDHFEFNQSFQKIVSCANSMINDRYRGGEDFNNLELLAIDEPTKFFDHLNSGSVKEKDREKLTNAVISSMKSADKVLLADADLNDVFLDHLRELMPDRRIKVFELVVPNDKKVILTTPNRAKAEIYKRAAKGQKLIIPIDTVADLKTIESKLIDLGLNVLSIYSEVRDSKKVNAFFSEPNNEAKKYDSILFTTSMDSGVSIVTPRFDAVIGHMTGVLTPHQIHQMPARDRTQKEWIIGTSSVHRPANLQSKAEVDLALTSGNFNKQWSNFDKVSYVMNDHSKCMRSGGRFFLEEMFRQKGFEVEYQEGEEEDAKIGKEHGILKKHLKNQKIERIGKAQAISTQEFFKMEAATGLSLDELDSIERYKIENEYCMGFNEDLITKFLSKKRYAHRNYETLIGNIKDLQNFDDLQAENLESLSLRKNYTQKTEVDRKIFNILGLDIESPHNTNFNHIQCSRAIEYITSEPIRLAQWNHSRPDLFLEKNQQFIYSIQFFRKYFATFGLEVDSERYSKKRLSGWIITKASFDEVKSIVDARAQVNKVCYKMPAEWLGNTKIEDLQDLKDEYETSYEEKENQWAEFERCFPLAVNVSPPI